MKKIFLSLAVILLSLFAFPTKVYADAGLPFEPYLFDQVMISNKEGAKFYKYDIRSFSYDKEPKYVIPYGEIVDINGKGGSTTHHALISLNYKGTFGVIREEDVKPLIDFYEPTDENQELDDEIYVYKEGGYLYKGPSYIFDKVMEEEIPVGTILKADKNNEYKRTSSGNGEWYYVEYEDKAGWITGGIEIYDYDGQYFNTDVSPYAQYIHTKGIVKDKTVIYSENEDIVGTIQGDQEYESYYQKDMTIKSFKDYPYLHTFSYIKTETLEGWVSDYCLLTEGVNKLSSYILSDGSISIYDSDLSTEIAKGRISGEYIIKQFGYRKKSLEDYKYEFVPVYLIEYDSNKYGFVRDEDVVVMFNYQEKSNEEQLTNTERHIIWSEPTTRRERVGVIEEGEPLNYKYRFFHHDSTFENHYFIGGNWTYIETEKYKGWINKQVFDPGYNRDWINYKKYTEIHDDVDYSNEINNDVDNSNNVKNEVIITFVICGGLVLTAGIVLIIYNKKRKK